VPETNGDARAYWRANLRILALLLGVWALAGFGLGIVAVPWLNGLHVAGFPLGFWFAQQGSILVFIVLIFFYAWRMNALDRKFGADE
jgi:putative solute:sodium symporter small subunit